MKSFFYLLVVIVLPVLSIIGSNNFSSIATPTAYPDTSTTPSPQTPQHSHQHGPNAFCAFDEVRQQLAATRPDLLRKQDSLDNVLARKIKQGQLNTQGKALYTLPVVVHVVHNNGPANIPNAQVQAAIQHLNDAFANVGYYNPATGVDVEVQFCLASQDPQGNTTTGITNTVSPLTNLNYTFQDLALKNTIRWNPLEYINIWVVDEICSNNGCGVAGYAYFPSAHGSNIDGIVLEANYMGSSNSNSSVLVHEMGHYLGLYHTFQDGCVNNDCTTDNDKVCDTPPDGTTAHLPCSGSTNSCTTDDDDFSLNNPFRPVANGGTGDQPDQFQNYMDYSNLICYDRFSLGQKLRTHFFIVNVRNSLLSSPACFPACATPITAGFTASATTTNAGSTINFTNTSTGATTYQWYLDGISFASTTNSSYTFNSPGTYQVVLEAGNSNPACRSFDTLLITVVCPVQAAFSISNFSPQAGDTITLTNNSTNASSYQWIINSVPQGTSANLNYTIPSDGAYAICLVASNGNCDNTFCDYIVADPPSNNANCGNTFVKEFGSPLWDDYGMTLLDLQNDVLVAGGVNLDSISLTFMSVNGTILQNHTFKITFQLDRILEMIEDSDGNIIGVGGEASTNGVGFVFKFSPATNSLIWSRSFQVTTACFGILEKAPNGNYIINANKHNSPTPGNNDDASLIEIDRNTGQTVATLNRAFGLNTSETFYDIHLHNGSIYTCGRWGIAPGFGGFRAAFSKHSLSGAPIWANSIFRPASATARMYAMDMLFDQDSIVAISLGDYTSTNFLSNEIFLSKLDTNGNQSWSKSYSITGFSNLFAAGIVQFQGGYLINIHATQAGIDKELLLHTDPSGNIIWCNSYGGDLPVIYGFKDNEILIKGANIFLLTSIDNGGDVNQLLFKLDSQGNIPGGCSLIAPATANVSNLPVITNTHNLIRYPSPLVSTNLSIPVSPLFVSENTSCNSQCTTEICGNGIDDDNNGQVDEGCPTQCVSTFSREIGSPGTDEWGQGLLEDSQGNIYIVGTKGDSALLIKLAPDGTPFWHYTLNLGYQHDKIVEIIEDSDGNLVGAGLSSAPNGSNYMQYQGFIFKFNPTTQNLIWVQQVSIASSVWGLVEPSPGANYIISGGQRNAVNSLNDNDPIHWELDRNTGTPTGSLNLLRNITGQDNNFTLIEHNGALYACGVIYDTRHHGQLAKFDLSGNPLWLKTTLYPFNSPTGRIYAHDIKGDQDSLVILYFGDFNGTTTYNSHEFAISKSDTSGNIAWAKKYSFPSSYSINATEITVIPDGYLITAISRSTSPQAQQFIIKVDKQGNIIWSKAYGNNQVNISYALRPNEVIFSGNAIYTIMTINKGTDDDILLLKLDQNGNASDSCTYVDTITITTTPINNATSQPYAQSFITPARTLSPSIESPNLINLAHTTSCQTSCQTEICGNGIDDDNDGQVDEGCANQCVSKRGNIWYFGLNAGLDFNTGSPVELTNSQMATSEGCATISDPNGQLQFYTDGSTVWDRNHNIMPNGTGLFGNPSSTHAAVIVPHPGSNNLYYIFTTDHYLGSNGLRYSIVDMLLNNGNGAVISKNNLLLSNSTEKIVAITHCNLRDTWLVAHEFNTNNYYVYKIDNNGLNPIPSIQGVGSIHGTSNEDKIGYIKATQDGSKIAVALYNSALFEVLDFDNSTGTLSNPITLANFQWYAAYGVEFSPNNQFLYATSMNSPTRLLQFDLSSGVQATILSSATTLSTQSGFYQLTALQLGPDGKIYVARANGFGGARPALGAINNPNSAGMASNYQNNAISLTGGQSRLGLPNLIPYNQLRPPKITGPDSSCTPALNTYYIDLSFISCYTSNTQWRYQGPNTVVSMGLDSLIVDVQQTGIDTIIFDLYLSCDTISDTIFTVHQQAQGTLDLGNDTTLCQNAVISLNAGSGFNSYKWQDHSTDSTFTATESGTYWVDVTTNCNDTLRDSITITIDSIGDINLQDTSICQGDTLSISLPAGLLNYQWFPDSTISCDTCAVVNVYPDTTTDYIALVSNSLGCISVDTITITVDTCAIFTYQDTFICANDSILLNGNYYLAGEQDSTLFINVNGIDSIVVTTATAYSSTDSLTIANALQITDPSCFGGNDGTAFISLSGNLAPFTYQWSNGDVGNIATGLARGNYEVTIIDGNNCTVIYSFVVNDPPPIVNSIITDSVNCTGGSDGMATGITSGGTPPYAYSWSNGQLNGSTANGFPAGTHFVTITDANNCSSIDTFQIFEPASLLSLSVTNTVAACFGQPTGTATVAASGGTPGYSYQWSTGQFGASLNNLTAGSYFVTVTDSRGCTASTTVQITAPPALIINVQQFSNYNGAAISCPGATDGAAQVTASGGVPGYTYLWSGPVTQNTTIASGLAQGTYFVTVTDAAGCSAVDSITLTDPVPLQATETHTDVFCNGDCDGQIIVNAVSGTGTLGINGYEYRIVGPGQTGNVFSSNNNFLGLCAGTYTVEVRDGNNCVLPVSITLTEPPVLAASATGTDASCNGAADGTATVTATGGVAPYSYSWPGGLSGNPVTGLAAGGYDITVTDANGCDVVTSVVINEPTALTASVTFTEPSCNNGGNATATATPSGGTAPYSYFWSNGQNGQTAIGYTAGNHTVTISDANNCQIVRNVTITQPAALTVSITGTNLNCSGNGSGTATATPTGGTGPYTYQWSNNQTTQTATGLSQGVVSVIVTDANNCQALATTTLTQPNPLQVSLVSTTNATCNGAANGSATVTASGGSAPYTYNWSNGQAGATATGLTAGIYTASVTDNSGCTQTIQVNITEPNAISIDQINTTMVSCKGGSDGTASAFISGGTAPYTFSWTGGGNTQQLTGLTAGTYNLTLTDANGCSTTSTVIVNEPAQALTGVINTQGTLCSGGATGQLTAVISGGTLTSPDYNYQWSNGATTPVVSGVTAGTYSVTVTDDNGCTLSLSATVNSGGTIAINSLTNTDVTCEGGSDATANVAASGGAGTLVYNWSNGQAGTVATGLSAGTYYISITDDNGCTYVDSVTVQDGPEIIINTNISDANCFGESSGTLTVTNAANFGSISWNDPQLQVGAQASNLAAGQYTVTVVTLAGCPATETYTVGQPDELVTNIEELSPVACRDDSTGSLRGTASGGTGAYSFSWSNGGNNNSIAGLGAGSYSVTVSDANGCTATDSEPLGNPDPLALDADGQGVICVGDNDGNIVVSGIGGTTQLGNYEFSIDSSNWQAGNLFPNLSAGIYNVYVRDNNGCVAETIVNIDAADPFFITSLLPGDTTIEYGDTIVLEADVNDPTGAVVNWIDVSSQDTIIDSTSTSAYVITQFPAERTIYRFVAVSPAGCVADTSMVVDVNKTRVVGAPSAFTPNLDGANDRFFIQANRKVTKVTTFRVYDRWGELVFENSDFQPNDPLEGWDGTFQGKPMNSAVFAWYAEVEFIDGHLELIRGDVTLLR